MTLGDPIAFGLPHRAPFIFIDEVLEVVPGESATCRKTFSPDEPFFAGHFPCDPVVPGVILTEAQAQTAGIAAGRPGISFRLSAIKGMKFFTAVRPGDEIRLTARRVASSGGLWQFEASAEVRGSPAAAGTIVLSETPPPATA